MSRDGDEGFVIKTLNKLVGVWRREEKAVI